jgi:transcriptional regulator with XRE-family HTH domain
MNSAEILQRKIREAQGERTQRKFARKLRISLGTLTRIRNNPQNVTLRTLERIAKALKTTPAALISDPKTVR